MQTAHNVGCGKMQASAISEYSRAGSGFVTFLPSWECHWSVSSSILHSASYYNAELAGWCNLRERERQLFISIRRGVLMVRTHTSMQGNQKWLFFLPQQLWLF